MTGSESERGADRPRRLALIASKGTLDWAYPPFLLASTAAAMGMEAGVFFTFYGLPLLLKDLDPKVSPHSNPAMPMKLPFGPDALRGVTWPVPNLLSSNLPGFDSLATAMMKKTFERGGVATVSELRQACIDSGVRLIACQMTMSLFGFDPADFIDEAEPGGAATFLEYAVEADVSLFV